jgi:hypothetical protein
MHSIPTSPAALALSVAIVFACTTAALSESLWVAPGGSDKNNGSQTQPLASISFALDTLRDQQQQQAGEMAQKATPHIILRGGIYQMVRPISPNSPLTIEAAPGEHPILSGGWEIRSWHKLETRVSRLPKIAQDKVWVADVPRIGGQPLAFRQLWINDNKAIRARNPNGSTLARLIFWNKSNQTATIPAATLLGANSLAGLEMTIDQVWEIAVLRVKSIRIEGTNALIQFQQPESKIEFEHPWPPVIIKTNYHAPFFLANTVEFLDSPGEWFEDLWAGKIYYWPREGEDMTKAKVFAPALETLVQIEGSSAKPVTNIQFKGITFAYTTWLRPSQQGHVPLQAGMFLLEAKKLSPKGTPYHRGLDNLAWIGRPPGAVAVKNASHVIFENCTFEHLASAGLDFQSGTHDNLVQGCTFRDIGGTGLQLGEFSDTNVETHVPYNPPDESEICSADTISNNLFTGCGTEDWGCPGICIGYARNISITHNEVCHLPYTGISVGWGWTKMTNASRDNFVFANHVHHVGLRLGDLAGIYTLSAQPGTVIAENSVSDIRPGPYVPDPNHWFYIYLDEGSSFITVRDNWCPAGKFMKNANGPGNVWTNNGPQVSGQIKNAAGLEPTFKDLLKSQSQ